MNEPTTMFLEPSALAVAAMEGARTIADSNTEPDDDWVPMLLVATGTGEAGTLPLTEFFVDDERRTILAEKVLPALIEDMDVRELVIVNSVWVGEPIEIDGVKHARSPREDENRTEAVLVVSINADRIDRYMARITRHADKPPTLEGWEHDPGIFDWGTSGLIHQKALEAFRDRL